MRVLRRFLYLMAAVNVLVGLALAILPKFVTKSMFGQVALPEYALAAYGAMAAGGAVWWWSWAFVIVEGLIAVVAALNALFGLDPGSSAVLWWLIAVVNGALTAGLLWGIGKTGQDRPLP